MKRATLLFASFILQGISTIFTDYTLDWDEAGNYWEPLHFLLYKTGLQTWEWNANHALRSPLQPLVLASLGKIFQTFGFSRYMVFYLIRLSVAAFGVYGLYVFSVAINKKFGPRVSFLALVLTVFNHYVLFFMNRVNMDSIMAILNLYVFAFWLERKINLVLFWGVQFPTNFRNCVITFLIIFSKFKVFWYCQVDNSFLTWKARFKRLFVLGLSVSVFWLVVFFVVDSLWYGKPTLAFYNFLYFNIIKNQNSLFGVHSPYKFLDCFLRDNNIIPFIGSLFGMISVPHSLTYVIPYIVTFLYHQLMSQKQERFVYFLYPIMCLYCAFALNKLLSLFSSNNKKEKQNTRPYLFMFVSLLVYSLLVLYAISGVSTTLLRVYQYYDHHTFYKYEIDANYKEKPFSCLTAVPWASWWLPLSCSKIYTIQLYDEFFPGFNRDSFHRFEKPHEWALISIENTTKLFIEEQNNWNDTTQMIRFLNISKSFQPEQTALETDPITYIFVQGTQGISKKTKLKIEKITKRKIRHHKQSLTSYYYETILGSYLASKYSILAEAAPLGYFYDISFLHRNLGLWMTQTKEIDKNRVAALVAWKRNKERFPYLLC